LSSGWPENALKEAGLHYCCSPPEARESAELEHILRALEEAKWNVSGAARVLGMELTNLRRRIRDLGGSGLRAHASSRPVECVKRPPRRCDARSVLFDNT
jgi:DNA-binding NtrC family response regulator